MAKKRLQKWLAFCLAVSMLMGTTAMAADSETINNPDGTVTIKTTQTNSSEKEDGNTLVVVEIEKKTDGTTNKGVKVDRDEKRTESTVKNENGKKLDYHWVEEGTDIREWATPEDETDPSVTVDLIPGKQTDASASETTVRGDVQQGEDDKEYDYTKTTEYDRTVTATTGEVRTEIHDADTGLVSGKDTVLKPLEPVYDENDNAVYKANGGMADKNAAGEHVGKKDVFDRNYLTGESLDRVVLENGIVIWVSDSSKKITNIDIPDGTEVPEDFTYSVGQSVSGWFSGTDLAKNKIPTGATYKNNISIHNINNWYDEDGDLLFSEDGEFMFVGTGEHGKFYNARVEVIYQKQEVLDENGEVVLDENGNPKLETVYDENGDPVIEALKKRDGTIITIDGVPTTELPDEVSLKPIYDDYNGGRPKTFMLMDKNGNRVYAYCCDMETGTAEGTWYTVSNLEDSNYYGSKESEEHIRSIVMNGYWGTSDIPKEDGTYETGSLEKIKQNLKNAINNGEMENETVQMPKKDADGKTVVDENGDPVMETKTMLELLDDMTEGEALLATQSAIWAYANGHVNALNGVDGTVVIDPDGYKWNQNPNADSKDGEALNDYGSARVDFLYKWLINLDTAETNDVIINEQNFVKDVSLTVYDKSADHENNFDDDDANDVYDTELNFKLAFVPGDNDDLLVQISYTDLDGKPVNVVRRLAGENEEGQSYETIEPELDGSYVVEGLKLSENEDFNFDLRLEGTQYLEKGVYVYAPVGGRDVSQTFVGVAEGERNVDVSMGMTIRFDVDEDNHIRAERHWREEGPDLEPGDDDEIIPPAGDDDDDIPKGDDDDDDTTIGDDDVPKDEFPGDTDEIPEEDTPKAEIPAEDIPEEDVPLADVPKTGDVSALWFALSALSGAGLVGLNLTGKKREDEE